jgi:hypothetical protein
MADALLDYSLKTLKKNRNVIFNLLEGVDEKVYRWKSDIKKWCLLEVICHLYDEERLDFRTRIDYTLHRPGEMPPTFDTQAWIIDHDYINQDYQEMLSTFFEERNVSIKWLEELKDPKWDNFFEHPRFGKMTARMFLANWIAHDYLHIRQIIKVKFQYLDQFSSEQLSYAGNW